MWKWNSHARRYIDDATGQFMARNTVLGYVQGSLDGTGLVSDTLASLVGEGRLAPTDWRFMMREEIKREYIRQYILGIGGRDQMTQADWGRIGGMLKEQYGHLDGFYNEVFTGKLSEKQIAARARMYVNSGREGHERANAEAWGSPPLPTYPGRGDTRCLTNCACAWDIRGAEAVEELIRWSCYWVLGPVKTEHCPDCLDRSLTWAPLIVEKQLSA